MFKKAHSSLLLRLYDFKNKFFNYYFLFCWYLILIAVVKQNYKKYQDLLTHIVNNKLK